MALFSVYFSYSLVSNSYIEQILVLGIKELKEYLNKISPTYNLLRTQIMLFINHHIITYGP